MVEARGHLGIMDFAFLGDHNLGTWSGTLDHVLYIFVVETEFLPVRVSLMPLWLDTVVDNELVTLCWGYYARNK